MTEPTTEMLPLTTPGTPILDASHSRNGPNSQKNISLWSLFILFLTFGCRAWGGPMPQIDMLRQYFVVEQEWIPLSQFYRVLAVYQALPGPEASELCVYFGYIARGRWGGLLAGLGFLLPGFSLMLALSVWYVKTQSGEAAQYGLGSPVVQASFRAIQPLVAAMVVRSVYRIGRSAAVTGAETAVTWHRHDSFQSAHGEISADPHFKSFQILLLGLMFWSALHAVIGVNFIIIFVATGIYFTAYCARNKWIQMAVILLDIVLLVLLATKVVPGIDFLAVPGLKIVPAPPTLYGLFLLGFFAGLLSFGGAYTAIPYVQQEAVVLGGWLSASVFLDGIALGSVLPAPLVIFSTFVGFVGGGFPGAFLTTLGMFIPAFAFTLLGHTYLERLVMWPPGHAFFDGMTSGVVGLVAVTALQLVKEAVDTPMRAVLLVFFLYALMHGPPSPWLQPALVAVAIVSGQVLLIK